MILGGVSRGLYPRADVIEGLYPREDEMLMREMLVRCRVISIARVVASAGGGVVPLR